MKTVLIVESEKKQRQFIIHTLEKFDLDVIEAANGREGFFILEQDKSQINLIILDVLMPENDGWEFLKRIKAHAAYKKIPVILIPPGNDCGWMNNDIRSENGDSYPKSLNPEDLCNKVKQVLGIET